MTTMIGVSSAVVCPSASSISPCTCSASSIDPNGLFLNCANWGLSDSKMNSILNVLTNSKGISPLVALDASSNSLTKVPSQISKFHSIRLDFNQIKSIHSGAFNLTSASSVYINLWYNKITSISSGVFSFPSATSISIYHSTKSRLSLPVPLISQMRHQFTSAYHSTISFRFLPVPLVSPLRHPFPSAYHPTKSHLSLPRCL